MRGLWRGGSFNNCGPTRPAQAASLPHAFRATIHCMFRKVLIANRGEIAVRVMRTLREMQIASVAVFSDADRKSLHVRMADEAEWVGPPASSESYLRIDRILEAARKHGAEAIHPGYGFLSENADFAAACEAAGIVFIGPSAESIRRLGSKTAARQLAMAAAGAPVVPGAHEVLAGPGRRPRFCPTVRLSPAVEGGGRRRRQGHAPRGLRCRTGFGISRRRQRSGNALFKNPDLYVEKANRASAAHRNSIDGRPARPHDPLR